MTNKLERPFEWHLLDGGRRRAHIFIPILGEFLVWTNVSCHITHTHTIHTKYLLLWQNNTSVQCTSQFCYGTDVPIYRHSYTVPRLSPCMVYWYMVYGVFLYD